MIKFATIGTNIITDNFLKCAKQCPQLEYSATYSRSENTARDFAAKYGISAIYTDLEDLAMSNQIDAIYIASPTSLHFEQAMLMMKHGKHVLVEKPITSNEKEALLLKETADANNVVLLEALRAAFDPSFHKIIELLPQLGTIRQASLSFGKYSSRYDNYKNGIIENAFNPYFSNGALMDIGVYCIHPMVKLFGMPESISSSSILLDENLEGAGKVLAHYKTFHVDVTYSKISTSYLANEIQGENATLLIDSIPSPRELTLKYNDGTQEVFSFPLEGSNMIYEAQVWADCIQGNCDASKYHNISMIQMKVMDEIRRQQNIIFPADNK